MLDDLYKGMIVTVTENYVHDDKDLAAGDAFQAIFKVMNDKGYHQVRLLDGTGQPYDDDNTPAKASSRRPSRRSSAVRAGTKKSPSRTASGFCTWRRRFRSS
ncbi:MAG: hypothetical protein R3B90_08765 [Planctomycetaceae bacterium]